MNIKVGDNVLVIAGADRGKTGKVLAIFKKNAKVVVEGIHIITKHQKPSNTNEQGGIIKKEAPIHISNVKKIDDSAAKEVKKATKSKEKEVVKKETKATKKASK